MLNTISMLGSRFRSHGDMQRDVYLGNTASRDINGSWVRLSDFWLARALPGKYAWRSSCVDQTHPGPPFHSGGTLWINTYSLPSAYENDVAARGYYPAKGPQQMRYIGGFGPAFNPFGRGSIPSLATLDLWVTPGKYTTFDGFGEQGSEGASAWSKFKPNRPVADAGVFIAELRDVPRMLKTTSRAFSDIWKGMGGHPKVFGPKNVADHFLNTQFGWLPFLNDMRKFKRAYDTLESRLARIREYNNRWEKRGGVFSSTKSRTLQSSSASVSGHTPSLNSYWYGSSSPGSYQIYIEDRCKIWFEASFKYYIPEWKFETGYWKAKTEADIFGAMPCPSVVWEATPWSWLADWFGNAGDVISNMTDGWAENLVAKYAYLMTQTERVGKLHSTLNLWTGMLSNSWEWNICSKRRSAASPFGFGLSMGDLSLRQLAILMALGITRSH